MGQPGQGINALSSTGALPGLRRGWAATGPAADAYAQFEGLDRAAGQVAAECSVRTASNAQHFAAARHRSMNRPTASRTPDDSDAQRPLVPAGSPGQRRAVVNEQDPPHTQDFRHIPNS